MFILGFLGVNSRLMLVVVFILSDFVDVYFILTVVFE